ncbi:MAG: hypothetical protein QXV17_06530 [Candidatus Micrarchaeaceae archaeon]
MSSKLKSFGYVMERDGPLRDYIDMLLKKQDPPFKVVAVSGGEFVGTIWVEKTRSGRIITRRRVSIRTEARIRVWNQMEKASAEWNALPKEEKEKISQTEYVGKYLHEHKDPNPSAKLEFDKTLLYTNGVIMYAPYRPQRAERVPER